MESQMTVRRATPQDLLPLGQMVDKVFRPQLEPGIGMPREFPHLFSEQNAQDLYYLADGDKPASLVGVLRQEVVLQGVRIPVASIGSVCTLPEYEGKRLASQILAQVMEDLTADRIPLMLVSGDRGLYRRAECVTLGKMFEVNMSCADVEKAVERTATVDNLTVEEVAASDRSAQGAELARIYRREAYRFRRTDEEMSVLLDALWFQREGYDQRLFKVIHNGQLAAYVVGNISADRPQVVEVMEWAGSRTAFLASLSEILQAFQAQGIRFHVHVDDLDMQNRLVGAGVTLSAMPLQGTFRVLDAKALFASLEPVLQERLGGKAQVRATDEGYTVELPTGTKTFTHMGDLARFVFDDEQGCLGIPFVHTDDLNFI